MNLIHIMKDDNGDFEPLDLSPVFYKGNTMYVPHWRIKNTWVFPGGQTYTTTELIGMGAKDYAMALRWIHEAEETNGDDSYLAWTLGLPYRYFAKQVQSV